MPLYCAKITKDQSCIVQHCRCSLPSKRGKKKDLWFLIKRAEEWGNISGPRTGIHIYQREHFSNQTSEQRSDYYYYYYCLGFKLLLLVWLTLSFLIHIFSPKSPSLYFNSPECMIGQTDKQINARGGFI